MNNLLIIRYQTFPMIINLKKIKIDKPNYEK